MGQVYTIAPADSNAGGPPGPQRRLDGLPGPVGVGVVPAPSPFATSCILRPLISVSGCCSAKPPGSSLGPGGTSRIEACTGSERWSDSGRDVIHYHALVTSVQDLRPLYLQRRDNLYVGAPVKENGVLSFT